MSTEIEIVKNIFNAINGNEISAMVEYFSPDAVRIEPAGYDTAGTHRGHAEIKAHMEKGRSTWAEGSCSPEKFEVHGNRIIAFLHVVVRLKDRTDWIDGRLADVFTFENDKVIEMRTFWECADAVEWVKSQTN